MFGAQRNLARYSLSNEYFIDNLEDDDIEHNNI